MSRFVRFTATLLLLAFGWRVSAAYLEPCNESRDVASGTHGEPGDGCCPKRAAHVDEVPSSDGAPDHDGCSCPIHCGACCDGAAMHALTAEVVAVVLGVSDLVELPETTAPSTRSDAGPRGILHVPRIG